MTAHAVPILVTGFTPAELEHARVKARSLGVSVTDALASDSRLDDEVFVRRLAKSAGTIAFSLLDFKDLAPAYDLWSFAEAVQRHCIVFRTDAQDCIAVIADPFDVALLDVLEDRATVAPQIRVASAGDIAAFLARHEETLRAMDDFSSQGQSESGSDKSKDISLRSISEDGNPVVRLVNSTLYDALKTGASDIHLESAGKSLVIKYRIDGVLATVGGMEGTQNAEHVISRIKVMSELDIAERRVPQDGRFRIRHSGRDIDIRVSIMPSIHGEDAVLRILDKERLANDVGELSLEALGFDAPTMQVLRHLASEPYGMLLTTGPTGSGKTTTLYAAINEINHGREKIVTIEDPVEYQLPGVLQIPVNDKKGLTFARGLRSILRHDPDKIMVGEIRDGETAQIAVQAALTGHLVLTTVHANNAFDVIGRFTHMGVDMYSLMAALNGVAAQRLVRLNCPSCLHEVQPSASQLQASGIANTSGYLFREGRGCSHCRGTGFKGRRAIAEVLVLDDELRELIVNKESMRKVKDVALSKGVRLLRDTGLDMVRSGETSLQELNRVVR